MLRLQLTNASQILALLVEQKDPNPNADAVVGELVTQSDSLAAVTIISASFDAALASGLPRPGVRFEAANATAWCGPTFAAAAAPGGVIRTAAARAAANGPVQLDVLQYINENPEAAAALGLGAGSSAPPTPQQQQRAGTVVAARPSAEQAPIAPPPQGGRALKGWEIAMVALGALGALVGVVGCTWVAAMWTLQRRNAQAQSGSKRGSGAGSGKRSSKGSDAAARLPLKPQNSGLASTLGSLTHGSDVVQSRTSFGPSSEIAGTSASGPSISRSLLGRAASGAASASDRARSARGGAAAAAPAAPGTRARPLVPSAPPKRHRNDGANTTTAAAHRTWRAAEDAPDPGANPRGVSYSRSPPLSARTSVGPSEPCYFDFVGNVDSPMARLHGVGLAAELGIPGHVSRGLGPTAGGATGATVATGASGASSLDRVALTPPQTKGAVMYRMAEAMQVRTFQCNVKARCGYSGLLHTLWC